MKTNKISIHIYIYENIYEITEQDIYIIYTYIIYDEITEQDIYTYIHI